MADSLSKFPIRIKILDYGEAIGEFNRLTAPLTVGNLLKRLPISGRIMPAQNCISILIGLKRGAEKPVNQVEAGTIAYWPQQGSLCIYPATTKTYSPMSKVGRIITNLELFHNLQTGSRLIIEKV